MQPEASVVLALLSGIAGYSAAAWRNRSRPWVSAIEYSDIRRLGDRVDASKHLSDLSNRSLFMRNIHEGNNTLNEISRVHGAASTWLSINSNAESEISSGISELRAACDPVSFERSIESTFKNHIDSLIEIAIVRNEVHIPAHDPSIPPKQTYEFSDTAKDGCIQIHFQKAIASFGSSFKKEPVRKLRLLPFIELVVRHEKDKIVKVLEDLIPILREQISIHKSILEDTKDIVDGYSRWSCEFSITNFGVPPFILFPESAYICIRGSAIRPINLPCRVLKKSSDNDGWTRIQGVFIVPSGTSENLVLVTNDCQKDIPNGKLIRGIYESGASSAFIRVGYKGREIPWLRYACSSGLNFRGAD